LRHRPRTAGNQPAAPDRVFSHRNAYTSVRAANSAPKNATSTPAAEPACTGPGGASKKPVCAGPGAAACRGDNSNNRNSRAFSTRNRANSANNPPPAAAPPSSTTPPTPHTVDAPRGPGADNLLGVSKAWRARRPAASPIE
jgi:hypothetical protein